MNNTLRQIVEFYKEEKQRSQLVIRILIGLLASIIINGIFSQGSLQGHKTSFNPVDIFYYGIVNTPGGYRIFQIGLFLLISAGLLYLHYKKGDTREEGDDNRNFSKENRDYGQNRIADKEEMDKILDCNEIEDVIDNVLGWSGEGSKEQDINKKRAENKEKAVHSVRTIIDGYDNAELGPHWIIVGPPGSGKTSNFLILAMMKMIMRGESVVAPDPKGELRKYLYNYAKKQGAEVREFNLLNTFLSDTVNFLDYISSDDDAMDVVNIIMKELGDGKEDYWAKGERELIHFTILYLVETREKGDPERSIAGVHNFIQDHEIKDIDAMLENDELPETSIARKVWRTFEKVKDDNKITNSFTTGCATKLGKFNDPVLDKITSGNDIDLLAPVKKQCVYFVLMSDTKSSNDFLATIFFTLLFQQMTPYADLHENTKIPINFVLEEFCNIGKIPDIVKKLATIRSRDMRVFICVQGLKQLDSYYRSEGIDHEDFFTSIGNHLLLGLEDDVTRSVYAKKAGTGTLEGEKKSYSKNAFNPLQITSDYKVSETAQKVDVVTSGDFQVKKFEQMHLFLPGYNLIKLNKFFWGWDPSAKELEETQELYINHTPTWWKEVLEDESIDEKDKKWLTDGIAKINEDRKIIEEEKKIKRVSTRQQTLERLRKERGVKEEGEEEIETETEINLSFVRNKTKELSGNAIKNIKGRFNNIKTGPISEDDSNIAINEKQLEDTKEEIKPTFNNKETKILNSNEEIPNDTLQYIPQDTSISEGSQAEDISTSTSDVTNNTQTKGNDMTDLEELLYQSKQKQARENKRKQNFKRRTSI